MFLLKFIALPMDVDELNQRESIVVRNAICKYDRIYIYKCKYEHIYIYFVNMNIFVFIL